MHLLLMFVKILSLIVLLFVVLGILRTWQLQTAPEQKLFSAGEVPSPAPDGVYHGTVPGHKVSWLGKKFHAAASIGINVFSNGVATADRYPFETRFQKGSHDKNTVLAIDYNISPNPWWLRPILDEVVQTAPGKLLGKLQLRVIPGYPFTLAYFWLEQN